MGNTNSMNNLSMLDQKRYSTEFLRYSQIPYESQYHQQQQQQHQNGSNPNFHQHFNKFKEPHALPNPVKVLPDVKFEPKLRTTNNGAILHSGGTISGRKESECALHRSKSISETQNTYLSNPNGMPAPPPHFKMQRASTQLSINLHHQQQQQQQQQPTRGNLNKNYGSSHDLKSPEMLKSLDRRPEKLREMKKGRAPPPPVTNSRIKMTPPPMTPAPDPPKSKVKIPMTQRMFGDTLTKNHQIRCSQTNLSVLKSPVKSKEPLKPLNSVTKVIPAPAKASPMSKINPISYLRRERTFDMSLMHAPPKEKFLPKFSPQLQKKRLPETTSKAPELRQMTTQERYRANLANRTSAPPPPPSFQNELQSATKRRSMILTPSKANDKMKTIDKPLKKSAPALEKAPIEQKKSDVSAISNPTLSTSSSFKYSKPKQVTSTYELKESDDNKYLVEDAIVPHETSLKEDAQQQLNNFYFGMQEASVDTDEDEADENQEADDIAIVTNDNDMDQAQMEAINRFAEDIFKMSGQSSYMPPNQMSTESLMSDGEAGDSDSSDILLNLRPTLPRRQLQIPRFSPVAAWKSLLVDASVSEGKGTKLSASMLQLHAANDEARNETKIERIYREPSFNMISQQLDNKSGDSGISAGENNSPDGQLPQAYLMSSWTPQQDLEEDEEESVGGHDKESFQPNEADKSQSFVNATNGHMFSLSLPRESHSSSDKTPQNNFYSLQKFRKTLGDVFGSITNVNDNKIQIHNYGMDSNWLLSSQPNSIDELSPRKENERNQIIKHVMYLPTNMEYDDKDQLKFESTVQVSPNDPYKYEPSPAYKYRDDEDDEPPSPAAVIVQTKSKSKNHKFKFQSTIRQVERRKIADKLAKEAEEKEMRRLSEFEAMQKVEEEFQKKRAREKNQLRHQLRIASLEESYGSQSNLAGRSNNNNNYRMNDTEDDIDIRTPYISRIIEAKSPKIISQYKS